MSRLLFALVGLVLLLAGGFLGMRGQETPVPSTQPGAHASRLWPGLGVTVALERYDDTGRQAVLADIRAAGFRWVRQRFPWDALEPTPGAFDWEHWDQIVDDVAARDLALVAMLDGSPAWARGSQDSDNALAPPERWPDFGHFAGAFAARYGDRVDFYQIWDEPNIAPHWGARAVDAAAYAGLLREASIQIRAADPGATVLLASLAPNTEQRGLNQSDIGYLADLYGAGAVDWFDGVAGQPYGFEEPPEAEPAADSLNFRRAELVRAVMMDNDDGGTPLWLTAYGWHSGAGPQSPWGTVDATTQARWAAEAASWARDHWPWMGGLAWAWWQPPQPPTDPHWGFALVDPGGRPREVLESLESWLQETQPLGPGTWPVATQGIIFEGDWRVAPAAADPPQGAQADNNRVLIPFSGTGLALGVARGPYWAFLDIAVDGEAANGIPGGTLVLHDPLRKAAVVTVADGLAAGRHLAEIVATGGWDQWPLREVIVWSSASAGGGWWSWLPWALVLMGSALLVASIPRVFGPLSQGAQRASQGIAHWLSRLQGVVPHLRYLLLAILAGLVAVLGGIPQVIALAALFGLLVAFPTLGPPLLAAVAPLFLVAIPVLGRPISPTEIAGWTAVAALATHGAVRWLAAGSQRRRASTVIERGPNGLDWAVVALTAVALLSTAAAQNLGVALRELRTVFLAGAVAYGLIRLVPGDPPGQRFDPWPTVWGIALGAVVVSLWGIYQAASGSGVIAAGGVARVRGPFGSPNNLALYLSHTLPILLGVALLAADRRKRLAAAVMGIPMAVALLLTFSRGALLLGLPAAVVFLGFAAGGRWRWVSLAAVAAGALAMLPLFRTERFGSLLDMEQGSGFFRLQLWQGAWAMAKDHPWLGVGPDNFLYAYRSHYVLPTAWQELNLSHPHNIVLDFWTRLGIPGLLVGVWLFVAAFRRGWQTQRRADGDDRALLLGLMASLVATVAHGLIDNSVFLVDLMILFMLTLGIINRLSLESGLGKHRQ